jgi:hypothetical protein
LQGKRLGNQLVGRLKGMSYSVLSKKTERLHEIIRKEINKIRERSSITGGI